MAVKLQACRRRRCVKPEDDSFGRGTACRLSVPLYASRYDWRWRVVLRRYVVLACDGDFAPACNITRSAAQASWFLRAWSC